MSTPGFTAEHALHRSRGHYIGRRGSVTPGVYPALISLGAFECGGTCPSDRSILCKGTKTCICCKYGCEIPPTGSEPVCSSKPAEVMGIGGGRFGGAGGGVFFE